MLPPNHSAGFSRDKRERQLLQHYRSLSESDRYALLRFARFLADQPMSMDAKTDQGREPVPEPRFEPAPEGENVIAAIRRLSRIYFMIDKDKMLHETTELMTQHVMQGRPAGEVIAALETLFSDHYRSLAEESNPPDPAS